MRYGIYTPNFGAQTDARLFAQLACAAEGAGWDGFFLWDHILGSKSQTAPVVDPWIALAAMAMTTERIRLGTTVTPVARRRPWKLARETLSLDHLSGGRLTLGVGLGFPPDADFALFGDEPNPKIRAGILDEGLEVLAGLWSGEPFAYQGKHYRVEKVVFHPRPVQNPRIPIWVGGFWPNKAPFRRAARWDGAFPLRRGKTMTAQDLRDIRAYVDAHRSSKTPFDLVMMGYTPGDDPEKAGKKVRRYAKAGLNWWLESLYPFRDDPEGMLKRIREGPHRFS